MNLAAQTLPLCEGLKEIMAATASQYVGLRGPFDSVLDEYRGKLILGSLTECHTHSYGNYAEYTCKQHLPDDAEFARRSFETLKSGVKACFGESVRQSSSTMPGRHVSFFSNIGGEYISIHYLRYVPRSKDMTPRYILTIDISIDELNEKR